MKKKLSSIYWFIFFIIYLETVYRVFIFKTLFSADYLYVILFSIPIAVMFYIICNIFKEKVNKIFTILLTLIISFIFIAQVVYFKLYEAIFSVFSVINATKQIMAFSEDIWITVFSLWKVLVLLLIPSIFIIIFNKKIFKFNKLKLKTFFVWFAILVVSFLSTFIVIKIDNKGAYSLSKLYYDTHAPLVTAKKVGLLTMTRYDLYRFVFGFEEKAIATGNNKEIKDEDKYNMLDINFDDLIKNEDNDTIKTMHEYFSSLTPTKKNKYTGMFAGKNLIFITAESFDPLAIDKELTPTLYKLANSGFVFKNYYQPLYPIGTADGEYMNAISLLPKEGEWSSYSSSKVYMPFAIGNMFGKLGYKTNAYHDHTYTFYRRQITYPSWGFTYYKGCGNGLEKLINCKIWPESDYEMMKATAKDYVYKDITEVNSSSSSLVQNNNQNFATYYMTVSAHLNYSRLGNNMARRNWNAVKDLPYSEAVKAYIACNIEFDKAMKYLLDTLEENGILDDTVIVISPDHYPYSLKDYSGEMSEILGYDKGDKFESFRSSLIIYNSEMKKVKVDKYATSIDVLPTVYNLFGLNYDSRLLMGRDILSDDSEGLIMLVDRSWITERGTYNAITDEFTPSLKGEVITQKYIDAINNRVAQKFSMSSLILSNDYYSHLGLK